VIKLFICQDYDDWDDVGLNIPRPPELPQLYRVTHKETSEVYCQTEEDVCSEEELLRLVRICQNCALAHL
jgi:hypothetical protein